MEELPQIPYSVIETTDDGFTAEPSESTEGGVERFDRAVRDFISTSSGWTLFKAHHSNEKDMSMIDLAIFVRSGGK
ncbi:hypothetical protein [Pseudodonghicola flavimaris]|uniref:Uncharacterized protein n=1 Tax=Pseudodonghicola flavimaris TaxID=3050036 RepID=A0ABT7F8H0_9RHOB|nr:hypothetical protein [Pseudodonghicola flavimaris]MDK3020918.1 hypothetical protein [Pseudodonghicola flavimaris]